MQQPTASTSALPPPTTTPSASSIHLRKRPQSSKPIKPWYKIQLAYELENKGSVARDHLASERTYLAWLRTSLSLASIGIAITQLFRLSSSPSTTDPSTPTPTAVSALVQEWSANPDIAALQKLLVETTKRLDALNVVQSLATTGGDTQTNPGKYRHLGKPVGGTFIAMALLFLALGTHRFFKVQSALMLEPSKFPPSRRSVAFSTFCVAGIAAAAFSAILATK